MVSEPLKLTINGRERVLETVDAPSMLDQVLKALELRADRVAVELNSQLAPRAQWAEIVVNGGDRLEIVHFVGGGTDGKKTRA